MNIPKELLDKSNYHIPCKIYKVDEVKPVKLEKPVSYYDIFPDEKPKSWTEQLKEDF